MTIKKIILSILLFGALTSNNAKAMENKTIEGNTKSIKRYYNALGEEIFFYDGIINFDSPGGHLYPDYNDINYRLDPISYEKRFKKVWSINYQEYAMSGLPGSFLEQYDTNMLNKLNDNIKKLMQQHEALIIQQLEEKQKATNK